MFCLDTHSVTRIYFRKSVVYSREHALKRRRIRVYYCRYEIILEEPTFDHKSFLKTNSGDINKITRQFKLKRMYHWNNTHKIRYKNGSE